MMDMEIKEHIDRCVTLYGGPAFPHPGGASDSTVQVSHIGMSLRDFFAGQVLASANGIPMSSDCQRRAELAYEQADAMLKEREK